jgi:hypothetical protein
MIITITGLEKLGLKAQRDLAKLPDLLQRGLIDGGRIAEAYASDYQFAYKHGRATGQVNARYTYLLENYYTIALYSASDHWRFVEYGTGVFHIPEPHSAWYKASYPFRGLHQGQHPQQMLTNATKNHLPEISKKVCDTVQGGLCGT